MAVFHVGDAATIRARRGIRHGGRVGLRVRARSSARCQRGGRHFPALFGNDRLMCDVNAVQRLIADDLLVAILSRDGGNASAALQVFAADERGARSGQRGV